MKSISAAIIVFAGGVMYYAGALNHPHSEPSPDGGQAAGLAIALVAMVVWVITIFSKRFGS